MTGGSDGIGFEAALKLVVLGATVIIASDNLYKADRAAQAIRALLQLGAEKMDFLLTKVSCKGPEGILDSIERYKLKRPIMLVDQEEDNYGEVHSIFLNLADLKSVIDAVTIVRDSFKGKTLDHVIFSASICPEDNVFSIQGHEIAFATNVLGHFSVVSLLIQYKMLRIESQVMVLGCEDYILAEDCTSKFNFPEEEYGYSVYRRSKLGQFWFARELQRRYDYLSVCIVHPGYCDTRLGLDSLYVCDTITAALVMSPRSAANVVVICAQYSTTLPKGVYFHNTCGQILLDSREIALNDERANAFWEMLDEIYVDYMRLHTSDHSVHINRNNKNQDHTTATDTDTVPTTNTAEGEGRKDGSNNKSNPSPRYIALN